MEQKQIYLPTEHLNNIKIDAIADCDGNIQLETKIDPSENIKINGIDYNDFRSLVVKYQI